MTAIRAGLRRVEIARNRVQLSRARDDKRAWVVKRRERTRQLIELGGLVVKAELIGLTDDDRAVILGLLVEAATKLRSENRNRHLTLCGGVVGALSTRTPSPISGGSLQPSCGHYGLAIVVR